METKKRHSKKFLEEIEQIIHNKLIKAREGLEKLKASMEKENENISDLNTKSLNNTTEIEQRDNLNRLIEHQEKFIKSLELAQKRVKLGTYGICVDTKKLISEERLRAVPHTTHSVEAKKKRIQPK